MPRLALATLAFGVVLTGGQLAGAQPARVTSFVDKPTPEQINFFEKKIRPVLVDSCYKCHSADAEKPKGDLLLDTREGTRKGALSILHQTALLIIGVCTQPELVDYGPPGEPRLRDVAGRRAGGRYSLMP